MFEVHYMFSPNSFKWLFNENKLSEAIKAANNLAIKNPKIHYIVFRDFENIYEVWYDSKTKQLVKIQ